MTSPSPDDAEPDSPRRGLSSRQPPPEPSPPLSHRPSRLFQESTPPPESPDRDTSPPHPSYDQEPSPSLGSVAGSGSAGRSTGRGFKARELRDAARGAVRTLGGIANRFLTRAGSPEREVELYLPDADDEKAIGDPLASIASRRLPDGAKNADLIDGFRVVLGVLAYLTKQAERKVYAEQVRAWEATDDGPDEPGEQPGTGDEG